MSTPSDVSMRQLRYFVAAAELGQFSQAALTVHVSQSAITSAVSQLESILGVRLFDRLPHGVTLTAEGHKFYQQARHILDTLQDALNQPFFHSHNLQGTVRVGASYTVLGYFLPNVLARFKRSYPLVEVDLIDMDRPNIEQGINDGSLELGLTIVSNVDSRQPFERHVLMRSRRQMWLSGDHPLMHLETVCLADIAEHAYIMATVDEGESSALRYWKSAGLEPNIAFRTSSIEALRGLVALGFGVTILSDMLYRPWSLDGKRIEARPISDTIPPMELGLIWENSRDMTAVTKQLQQFLISSTIR